MIQILARILLQTDNLTAACNNWPGVWRCESGQGLNFSVKLSFFHTTTSVNLHVYNQVQQSAMGGVVPIPI